MSSDPSIHDEPQPTPLKQRLMPQASVRSLIVLIALSAIIMWLVRAMFIGDFFWAKCIGAMLATIAACFLMYAGLFLLAHLFTIVSSPIVEAVETPSVTKSPSTTDDESDHDHGVTTA